MNDVESAESKEKSNFFSVFYFSSYGNFCLFFFLIFEEFVTMTQKVKLETKCRVGENLKDDHIFGHGRTIPTPIKTDRGGGNRQNVELGKTPQMSISQMLQKLIRPVLKKNNLSMEISSRLKIFFCRHFVCSAFCLQTFCLQTFCLFDILSTRHYVCSTLCLSTFCPSTFCLSTFCPTTERWALKWASIMPRGGPSNGTPLCQEARAFLRQKKIISV